MKRHFDKDLLDQIRASNDIVSLISEHMTLKKKGRNYWGCCPFHNEKTPSFSVTPEKGFYYCFGCHAKGDVITFLMNYEHLTFPEAVERLAQRANIALPEAVMSPEEMARQRHREELYKVNALAASFFHSCLVKTDLGKEGLAYFRDRGLSDETIERFQLGYAPDSWDSLYKAFKKRGISDQILVELGLCAKSNGKVYDYFRNRVMFPIADGKGRIVAFGGRVLDDSKPKYLNSPETDIFTKRRILFAFDKAYSEIRRLKQAILVEGYMDVISAHNRGVTNVIASLGTAYTKEHGQILMRQAEEIVVAYDMDGAGRTAAKRAIELLQNTAFKVKVLAMPDGKDPDDYIKAHGPDAFRKLIGESKPPYDYLLSEAMIAHDSTEMAGKLAILGEIFPFVGATELAAQRDYYLQSLALSLCMEQSTVIRYFREYLKAGKITLNRGTAEPKAIEVSDGDRLILVALLSQGWLQYVSQYVPLTDFESSSYAPLLASAQAWVTQGRKLSEWKDSLDEGEQELYYRLAVSCPEIADDRVDEALVNGAIKHVRLKALREQYKKHSVLADQLSRANDPNFVEELRQCQELQNLIKVWSSQ